MGGVAAAAGRGADAAFLNPAVLASFHAETPSELAVGYDALLESAYTGSALFARHAGPDGAFGAGLLYASQSAQTSYSPVGDATGKFTPSDLALGGWYAHRLLSAFSVAGGLKLIRSSLAEKTATTAAFDFGITGAHVVDLGDGPLDVGASFTNLGPPLKLGGTGDALPARVRAGADWHLSPTFDAGLDLVLPVDDDPYVSLGVEGRIPAARVKSDKPWVIAVRGGFDQSRTRGVDGFTGFSAGAGFDFSAMRVDYAWIPFGDLGTVNRITLGFRF